MRIISGMAKGSKLFTPPPGSRDIRPTSDRAREALFNILGEHVARAKVLDLFAGTGAFGLEAFSRGASTVIFVDNNLQALSLIKKNVLHCMRNFRGNCQIRVIDHDLTSLPIGKLSTAMQTGFDLIFADPPYSREISLAVVSAIGNSNLLSAQGLLVVEERYSVAPPLSAAGLRLIDQRTYGDAAFWIYRRQQTDCPPEPADAQQHHRSEECRR